MVSPKAARDFFRRAHRRLSLNGGASGRGLEEHHEGSDLMEMRFSLSKETKRYYRFEHIDSETYIYLKKNDIDAAGIDPRKGIVVTVEEAPGK